MTYHICHTRDGETWLFDYDDVYDLRAVCGVYACDPELNFTWTDAVNVVAVAQEWETA